VSLSNFNPPLPWDDSEKWRPGFWYPAPCSHDIEFEGVEFNVEANYWDLFRSEHPDPSHPLFGDIECLGINTSFIEAVKIANKLNPEKLFTASWIKSEWAQKVWP
jgi:hypothetical protein